mgnify:CR=1 FL=1
MKLTSKTICSIKLFVDLGEHYNEGFISLTDIAERKDISRKFMEQIIPLYKNSGLIVGARGNKGGYMLSKKPSLINLKDIIYISEGNMANNSFSYSPLDYYLNDLDKYTYEYLSDITLDKLVDKQIESYSNYYDI